MFFQLPDIQRIQMNVRNLSQSKQSLQEKNLSAFSYNQKNVEQTFFTSLKQIIKQNQHSLSIFNQIDDEIQLGYFIPNQINIEELVYQPAKLPEWFQYVFQKQYEKQKQSLNSLCKKTYKIHSLNIVKQAFQREAQSFRLLIQRYQILQQKQKTGLNIMGQAQIMKAKSINTKQKYHNFCKIIADKILSFLQQTISKSMNFSNSINTIGSAVINSNNLRVEPQKYYEISKLSDKLANKFKQTRPIQMFQIYNSGFDPRRTNKSRDYYGKSMYLRTSSYLNSNKTNHNNNNNNRYINGNFNNTLSDFYK